MLKIWGRTDSFNLQKVMWCVAELGLNHERIDAGGKHGVTDSAEYLSMNPNGRVPTIDDSGFILWESNAIVRYLSAKYGIGDLCPDDPQERADADRWMEWQSATVGAIMRPLIITMFRTKKAEREQAVVDEQIVAASQYWSILDRHLEDRDFLLGDSLTMGDIPMGCYVWRWFSIDEKTPRYPHLKSWYDRLTERPAYREHVMIPMGT